jgi:hypothetical protein
MSENIFDLIKVKEHIRLIDAHIKKMELDGVTQAFDFELDIMTTFPEFYDSYPFLVKKLCKRDDVSMLYKMLDNLDMVEKGTKSLANVELNLGEELAQKFLYPAINKNKK